MVAVMFMCEIHTHTHTHTHTHKERERESVKGLLTIITWTSGP